MSQENILSCELKMSNSEKCNDAMRDRIVIVSIICEEELVEKPKLLW